MQFPLVSLLQTTDYMGSKRMTGNGLDFHLFLNRINLKGNSERQLKEKNKTLSPNRENKQTWNQRRKKNKKKSERWK